MHLFTVGIITHINRFLIEALLKLRFAPRHVTSYPYDLLRPQLSFTLFPTESWAIIAQNKRGFLISDTYASLTAHAKFIRAFKYCLSLLNFILSYFIID